MKITKLVAAVTLACASIPAMAQDNGVAVGATVYGPQGGEVGTIQQVSGDIVVLSTGTNTATLPASAFVAGENGPLFGMTKADLNAAIEKAKADAAAKLDAAYVAGAPLFGIDGNPAGTVEAINADGTASINNKLGKLTLPREQFTTIDKGLALKFSAAQLEAALTQRAQAQAAVASALVAGAPLVTSDGVPVGKIRELDANGNAVIDTNSGMAFALPKNQFKIAENGALSLLMTDAQLKAAVGG